jgi:D-alanyl-D-alanine carboxypeptidase
MNLQLATLLLAAISVGTAGSRLAAQERPPVEPSGVPEALVQALQGAIDAWARTPGHRGVSASVVLANGAQWSGVAGIAGDAPLRDDQLIAVASITKTMTGAVILQLVDDGLLRLDDPIDRWLSPREHVDPAITIRQLLNHTNGLANYTASAALGAAIAADPQHVFTPDELLGFVGPPRFAPGAATEYTNTAFLLLGAIAERVTGRAMVDLYHQRLWEPLGLTHIFLPGYEEPPSEVATAYAGASAIAPLERLSLLSVGHSAFGLLSNARTIASWGRALFHGGLLSSDMQAAMRTLVPAAGNIPGESGTGLGIRAYEYLNRSQFGHSGGATLGSSLLLFDPESGVTVAVIMNQGSGAQHFDLAPRLLAIAAAP